jgi:hypothetical protein
MDASKAIDYLTRRSISIDKAIHKLSYLDEVSEALKIYQHFFPKEFASDKLKPIREIGDLHATLEKCLRLINQHLFNLPDWYFDELAHEESLNYVPIEPIFGEWWDIDFEELAPLWQVLLILTREVTLDWVESEMGRIIGAANNARRQWKDRKTDFYKLARLCRRQAPPLRHLDLALSVLSFNTGNPWLDTTYESPITVDWTVENIKHLRKSWREAIQANKHIDSLDHWLSEDESHISELLNLWSRALQG